MAFVLCRGACGRAGSSPGFGHGEDVNHQSIQHTDVSLVAAWREQRKKPVVVDACCYEQNIPHRW